MDDLAKEFVISYFDRQLLIHGNRPESLRWSGPGQRLHYKSLMDVGDIRGAKILDYGCGKGDFFHFLQETGIETQYSGFDINEKLIALAKTRFPGIDFRVFDVEKNVLAEDFDYIFLCGVFNLNVQGLDLTIRETLLKLFRHCRRGLAFNALSAHEQKKDFELHYVSPEEMFAFAVKNLSPFVSVRHDRMAYDFMMFVYTTLNSL